MPAPITTWHTLDCPHYELEYYLNWVETQNGTVVQCIWCAKDGSPQEDGAVPRHFMVVYTTTSK